MKNRCTNPKGVGAKIYHDRGIRVCQEWAASFEVFRDWSLKNGYTDGLTIERKNNDLGYNPENCRWATPKEQIRNRRNTLFLTAFDETKSLGEWVEDPRCTLSYRTLQARYDRGWRGERAISGPLLR